MTLSKADNAHMAQIASTAGRSHDAAEYCLRAFRSARLLPEDLDLLAQMLRGSILVLRTQLRILTEIRLKDVFYQEYIGALSEKVAQEIRTRCRAFVDAIEQDLRPSNTDAPYTLAFLLRLQGDLWRYSYEATKIPDEKTLAGQLAGELYRAVSTPPPLSQSSHQAQRVAVAFAADASPKAVDLRLAIAYNLAVFVHELLKNSVEARAIAATALQSPTVATSHSVYKAMLEKQLKEWT